MILLSLILIVLFAGCADQEISVVDGIKEGVVIRDLTFDSSTVYAGDTVGLNLEVQNVGERGATIISAELFGPEWATGDPILDITGGLSPSEPEIEFEGESRSTRWRLPTPSDVKTETTYSIGVRVSYKYESVYEGLLRVVEEAYLETLPKEEREELLENSGVVAASVTGGPLSVSPVKGRNFIVETGSPTRSIKFKVTNVGSGYTYTGDDIDTGKYQVSISSEPEYIIYGCGEDVKIGTTDSKPTIKLSKGESRIFTCWFAIPSGVVYKKDVGFKIIFDYNYYVDGMASITLEPTLEEEEAPPPPVPVCALEGCYPAPLMTCSEYCNAVGKVCQNACGPGAAGSGPLYSDPACTNRVGGITCDTDGSSWPSQYLRCCCCQMPTTTTTTTTILIPPGPGPIPA